MNEIAKNLHCLMNARGVSQEELAREAGCTQNTISKLLTGKSLRSRFLPEIAQALHTSVEELTGARRAQDQGAPISGIVPRPEAINKNVEPYVPSTPKRPVVARVIAGNFREAVGARTPDDETWEEHPRYAKSSELAVWLIVDGDSMDDGGRAGFREGDLILVDPDVSWESGDFVIIANSGDEWTFKRIRKDGPTWFMEALNPGYQPRVREIPIGWRVVAKVLEVMPKGRKVG